MIFSTPRKEYRLPLNSLPTLYCCYLVLCRFIFWIIFPFIDQLSTRYFGAYLHSKFKNHRTAGNINLLRIPQSFPQVNPIVDYDLPRFLFLRVFTFFKNSLPLSLPPRLSRPTWNSTPRKFGGIKGRKNKFINCCKP